MTHLEQISTHWPLIHDPAQFVLRYAPAIQRYLTATVRQPQDVEEITQNFLLRILQRGFVEESAVRGRFRDYLKAAVRNAAQTHLRKQPRAAQNATALNHLAAADTTLAADQEWLGEWR